MAIKADGSIIIDTRIDTKGMSSGISTVERGFSGLLSTVKKVGAAIAAVFAIRKIVQFANECIELGSDLVEVQNVVDVTFGQMSGHIEKFSKDAIKSFGLSELAAKQYTSSMGAMLKASGIQNMGATTEQITKHMSAAMKKNFDASGDAVTDMSIALTELSADIASFYNLSTDEAYSKIRSGLVGITMPLRQIGINMSEVNLEQFRMSQGMTTAYSKMTQQEKVMLRYQYLLSVTSDAQGDFARTSGSWANQTRVLRLQLQGIKADLGKGFINLFTPILQMINRLLAGLAKLASAFKAFTNLITGNKNDTSTSTGAGIADTADAYTDAADAAESYADATQDSADATTAAAKANKKYLSGLDEIHRFETEKADTSAGSGSKKNTTATPASSASSISAPSMDFGSLAKGETVIDKTALKMKSLFDMIMQKTQPAVNALKKLWNEGLAKLRNFSWTALKDFWNLFLVPLGNWTLGTGIPRFIEALNKGLMRIDWQRINSAMADLWKKLEPFAETVGEGLLWFWENVLVPLGTWTMNEVVPRFLTTLSVVISVLMAMIEVAKPYILWLWENLLTPIAKWTGEIFIAAWDKLNAGLTKFSDWCKENPIFIETIINLIIGFFAAWAITKLIGGIGELISTIGSLFSLIISNPIIAIIAVLIALLMTLWRHWDEISQWCINAWEWVKAEALRIWTDIKTNVLETWNSIRAWAIHLFGKIKNAIGAVWNGIKDTAIAVWTAITTDLKATWDSLVTAAKWIFSKVKNAVGIAWNGVKTGASTAWGKITTFLSDTWDGLKTGAKTAFDKTSNVIKAAWNGTKSTATTVWGAISSNLTTTWDNIKLWAKTKFEDLKTIVSVVWNVMKLVASTVWKDIKEKVVGFATGLKDDVVEKIKKLRDSIKSKWERIKEVAKYWWDTIVTTITTPVSGMVDKIGGFLDLIKGAFRRAFNGIKTVIKAPINAIIGFINTMITGVVTGINGVIDTLNLLSFTIPDWVPGFGGAHFGLNISRIVSYPQIPELARGAVIPPNSPFLAMLGDQKHGTNVEAPLDTIKQAVQEAGGGNRPIHIQMYLDGRVVYDTVIRRGKQQQQMGGVNPFELA